MTKISQTNVRILNILFRLSFDLVALVHRSVKNLMVEYIFHNINNEH